MNQIIEFLFLRSDSIFDSFTIAQTIVHVLILVLDLVIWTAFQSLIPWIVAAVKKNPMTKKGFRTLSIFFAVAGFGRALVATEDLAIAEVPRDLFALFCGVCVYAASFYLGTYIMKRHETLLEPPQNATPNTFTFSRRSTLRTTKTEKPHSERKAKLLRILLSAVLALAIAAGAFFIGHKVGYDESYNIGFNDGYKDGYTNGDERGLKAGYDEGFADAKRQYAPEETHHTVKYVGTGKK